MKSATKILLLVILLLPLVLVAQDENYVVAFGKLKIEWGNHDQSLITLYEDGKEIDTYSPSNNGKFNFSLELNHEYLFWFEKPGYVTKKVIFDTHVPEDVTSSPDFEPFPDFDFYVILFKTYPDVDTMFFTKPVGKIKFQRDILDFDYDKEYNLKVLKRMEEIEREIKRKHDEEVKLAKSAPPKEKNPVVTSAEKKQETDNNEELVQSVNAQVNTDKKKKKPKENVSKYQDKEESNSNIKTKSPPVTETKSIKTNESKQVVTSSNEETKQKNIESLKESDNKTKPKVQNTIKKDNNDKQSLSEKEQKNIALQKKESTKKPDKPKPKNTVPLAKTPKTKEIKKTPIVNSTPQRRVTPNYKSIHDKQKRDISKVEVSGKTITRTEVTTDGGILVYIKVEYTWGGRFFFVIEDANVYRNISENYYNIMISKK